MGMDLHLQNKSFVRGALTAVTEATPLRLEAALSSAYHPDAEWRGSHPLNELHGLAAIADTVWRPLNRSFPDLERRDNILIGGSYEGNDFVSAVGHYCGTFREDWLTIPATGRPIYLRYGEVHRVQHGRITQSTVLIDMLDVIRQAGFWPVSPSLGTEEQWPGPITADGVVLTPQDPAVSAASIAQARAMQQTLGDYNLIDRGGLMAMPQKDYWHPKMMWYGPAGIGTTRGLQGFVDYHQVPFRIAFETRTGGHHYIRIGDGAFSATGGWPSVKARHAGGAFMGIPPSGRDISMRVMDFYLHHEGLIRENWVPIDIIHLLLQMDIDVFGRMQSLFRRGR
jgi:predicted ester cyclase